MGTNVTLTAANSAGVPTACVVVLGSADLTVGGQVPGTAFFGGTLLTNPVATIPLPMPFSAPSLKHEMRMNFPLPNTQFTGYFQVLQLDSKAPLGVSFTQGMRIQVGS